MLAAHQPMLMLQYAAELLAFRCWQVQQRLGPCDHRGCWQPSLSADGVVL